MGNIMRQAPQAEHFVPFVMLWAKSVPAEKFYGPDSVFSESIGNSRIHPDDTDAEADEHTGPTFESSISYTF